MSEHDKGVENCGKLWKTRSHTMQINTQYTRTLYTLEENGVKMGKLKDNMNWE